MKSVICSIMLILFALPCYAFGPMMGGGVVAAGGSTYVGWPNTDGVPTGTPAAYTDLGDDGTELTRWVATENGTAVSVQFYVSSLWSADGAWVDFYKDVAGTLTLMGKGVVTVPGTNQWIGKTTLVVEGGQTLDFLTNDILYFGVSYFDAGGSSSRVGRDDAGGTGLYYNGTEGHCDSGPPATISVSSSANRLESFILEYTTP